jgi:gliding motility associated protien GldN
MGAFSFIFAPLSMQTLKSRFFIKNTVFSNMKSAMKCFSIAAFSLMISVAVAQVPEDVFGDFTGGSKAKPATTTPTTTTTTTPPQTQQGASSTTQQPTGATSGTPPAKAEPVENSGDNVAPPDADAPLDGIVQRKLILDKQLLPWEPIREADILWSKRLWRVIDVREKINLPFIYPEMPFFTVLMNGIQKDSSIRAYKADNDKFHYKLASKELQNILSTVDTITQIDPTTYETKLKVVYNNINPKDITRYRLKEDWYFDRQQSVLKVRILGIAPLKDVKNEAGEFMFEQPLFWIRYPDCREYLARNRAFIEGNDSNPMSWEDLFEQRRFSSYVTKESNVHNRRLQEYLQGIDLLLEGEKIKAEIFNYEHDLWSY